MNERTRIVKRIHAHMRQIGAPLPKGALKNGSERLALRARLPQLTPVLRLAIEQELAHYEMLTQHILAWEKEIERMVADWADVALLKELPGIQTPASCQVV